MKFLGSLAFLLSLLGALPASAQLTSFKILVFSATAGFRHASITNGIALIKALAVTNNFAVDTTEDATLFTDANLAQYQAIVFLNTTGDVLTNAQQLNAFQHYIEAGGGYVGVHAASDTFHSWAWYGGLVGAYFVSHPAIQQATVRVEEHIDPSTTMLPAAWVRTDEWYNFDHDPRGTVHVLANLDETSYSGGTMGSDHPIAWSHYYDGGRAWYTAGGHTPESYSEQLYQTHLLGGIFFAAGAVPGHPPITASRSTTNINLFWPSGAAGFVLETATNIQTNALWIPITNGIITQNGQQALGLPMTNSRSFFRLRK
jgi:type 1 glutamine amidotransferase